MADRAAADAGSAGELRAGATGQFGDQYSQFFLQTDLALSESTCSGTTTQGCTVPPDRPGHFYPYWSRVKTQHGCVLEFGNVSAGAGVNDFGGDKQYGDDKVATLGYPEFEGPLDEQLVPHRRHCLTR